jgi:tetratricopeptide (TPR) repeat protein
MNDELVNEAEFLLHVEEEKSIAALRNLLNGASVQRALPILRGIDQLYGGTNAEVLLSLAVRCFHQGLDDDAISFAKRANDVKPDDHQVLRVGLFLAAARGAMDEAKIFSERLLKLYPDDEWARRLNCEIHRQEMLSSISLPPLQTEWEAVINQDI